MRKILTSILALTLCLIAIAPLCRLDSVRASRRAHAYAPGEVIVKLKQQASGFDVEDREDREDQNARLMKMARSVGERAGKLRDGAIESLARHTANQRLNEIISRRGLDRVFVLKFDLDADVDAIINDLKSGGDVEYAEPNYRVETGSDPASFIPNDPDFAAQWPLRNLGLGVEGFPSTLDADIKILDAWAVTSGSPDVIVAVTDTGVDLSHPDLARNIYTNPREIPNNDIDDDGNGFVDDVRGYNVANRNGDTSDIVGHGTQMAGIIAAEMNNQAGISGVSQSKILPVRFFKRTGPAREDFDATIADAARALLYSIAAGATIINASWRTLLAPGQVPEDHAQALKEAVDATYEAGALLVCIAGNDGFDNDFSAVYPGHYQLPNQIVVAASDYNDEIWHPVWNPFIIQSGFGQRTVQLTAPGVSVLTTLAHGNCFFCSDSADPKDWYGRIDGTSASAAFVSGTAALVKSRYPEANFAVIRRRILESAEVRENLQRFVATSGRLNAAGALTLQLSVTAPLITRLKYKGGGQKLLVYGKGIQRDAVVMVGSAVYQTKPRREDFSQVQAIVPKSALPSGAPVEIKLRNPDGGESQTLTFTR